MSKLSLKTISTIKSHILTILYDEYPKPLYTSEISNFEARDKEFISKLLEELKKQGLIKQLPKTSRGTNFLRKRKWYMPSKIYEKYKEQTK